MRQLATETHIVTFSLNMLHIVAVCHTYGYISSHIVSNCCCQARGALSIQRCSLSELDGSVEMAFAQYWYKENQQKLSWCLGLILGAVWSLKGWSIAAFMNFSACLQSFHNKSIELYISIPSRWPGYPITPVLLPLGLDWKWSQSWLHGIVWALCHRSRHHQPGMARNSGTARLCSKCTKCKKIDQIWIGITEFGEHPLNFVKKTFAPALYDVHYFKNMLQNLSPKLSWSLPFSTRCSAASANATTSRRWSLLQEAKSLTHRILLYTINNTINKFIFWVRSWQELCIFSVVIDKCMYRPC